MKVLIFLSLLSLSSFYSSELYLTTTNSNSCKVYKAHTAFKKILTEERFWCYGKPMESYRIRYCDIEDCGKKYYRQKFCRDGEFTTNFYYADSYCRYSDTNYHDNLKVGPVEPCGCENDGISVGDDY